MRYLVLPIFFLLSASFVNAQTKREREFRILKSQFPENALALMEHELKDARRIRFYKEIDSTAIRFEAKFEKDKLKYTVAFGEKGILRNVGIAIKPVDIPDDSFKRIQKYLKKKFLKYRTLRMQQRYPVGEKGAKETIDNAFQNLMLPSMKYAFFVAGKKKRVKEKYEVLFDAEGKFETIRKSLPPNYDHVLY